MTKLCELPVEHRTYIVKELGNYSTIIDDKGNIEVRLDEDQKRHVARKINMEFCTTFNCSDIYGFARQYEQMINV